MSSYNDIYKEVKDILKKLYKKDCFSMFSAKDLFYLMDEKTRGILLFSDHMYQDGHGIQMFLNNTGLNYLHDLLSEEDPAPATYFYSDCHFLAFVPRKDLLPDDIKFFKDNKIRIYEDNNLLPIRFKEGYGKTIMSKKDLSDSLNYLFYTYALISNEKEDLSLAFERDLTPIAIFDNQAMSYTCHYTGLPNLEQMPKNKKVNYNLVDDLKDKEFVDDVCYIFHSYFPVKNTNESAYKTIVLAYYVKRKVYKMELFDCCPEKIEQSFYGFFDELIDEFGRPLTVLFNHRYLYSIANKTLKNLNIETKYAKNHGEYDKMVYELIVEHVSKFEQDFDGNFEDEEIYLDDNSDDDSYIS